MAKGEHGEAAQGSWAAIKEMRGESNQISVFKTAHTAAQQNAKGLERMEYKKLELDDFKVPSSPNYSTSLLIYTIKLTKFHRKIKSFQTADILVFF